MTRAKPLSIMTGLWLLVGLVYVATYLFVAIVLLGKGIAFVGALPSRLFLDWLDALDTKRAKWRRA